MHRLIPVIVRAALLTLLLRGGLARAESTNVVVVLSSQSAPYLELADSVGASVERRGGTTRILAATEAGQIGSTNADVVVAVGLKATEAVVTLDARIPVINALVPRASFERVAARRADKSTFTAVFLDQPIARQLELIRIALPERKRIGVILGPDSESLLAALTAETHARGMKLHAQRIRDESELATALQAVIGEADVLLSLPDSIVFTQRTIQTILFSAYRHQVPVVGFSPAYVRAGALIAAHSTPAQLGRQVAQMVLQLAARSTLPLPQHPEHFSVDINEHVARSLEIRLDSVETLESRLRTPRVPR